MKQQTFIACFKDAEGKTVNFERYAYKRAKTVYSNLKKYYAHLYDQWRFLYNDSITKAAYVTIYATPDGVTKEAEPVIRVSVEQFVKELQAGV